MLMDVEDVLSAALDAGTAIGVILVYFWFVEICFASDSCSLECSLQYPMQGKIGEYSIQRWWGNAVYKNTSDWLANSLVNLTNGTFG